MAATLCTAEQVKARGNIGYSGDDDLIASLIDLALRRLNLETGREFMPQVTEARTFQVEGHMVPLPNCDLRTVSAAVLHPELEAVALTEGEDFVLEKSLLTETAGWVHLREDLDLSSVFRGRFGYASLTITGGWGIWNDTANVPADINMAAIECILSWIDKPAESVALADAGMPREPMPARDLAWDVPRSAYLKVQRYNRKWGVR